LLTTNNGNPIDNNYIAVLSTNDMRGGAFRGIQYGVPSMFLPELKDVDNVNDPIPTRKMLALTLLHDAPLWEGGRCSWTEGLAVLQAKSDFEIWNSYFYGYWDVLSTSMVQTASADIKVSVYYGTLQRAWLIISNLSTTDQNPEILLSPKKIYFNQPYATLVATNALTQVAITVQTNTTTTNFPYKIQLPVTGEDFQIVRLKINN
jgi:hypothetical protein